ncbi:MAG TPA: TetR family transcriptional regulator [Friedmanniella sp.]
MTSPATLRKSERTKRAILEAARAQFTARGFDATSIRAVAADASIDPAMVMRYFGSKQDLFAAAVDVDLALPDLTKVLRSQRGFVLVEHFVRRWEGDLSDDVLVLLLRSAVTSEGAADRLRLVFAGQLVEMLRPLVEESELARRAGLISSQMLGLAVTRYLVPLPAVTAQSADQLVADLAPTLQRYLHGRLPSV